MHSYINIWTMVTIMAVLVVIMSPAITVSKKATYQLDS
jgi:hypothetical protein